MAHHPTPEPAERLRWFHSALLPACGLPGAWAGAAQWRVLAMDGADRLPFLAQWALWRADPLRPRVLHWVGLLPSAPAFDTGAVAPHLQGLAQELHAQAWGLSPGLHRLVFDGGRVLLTLAVGEAASSLREQAWQFDAVLGDGAVLDGFDSYGMKALARSCVRGTRLVSGPLALATCQALEGCGFVVQALPGENTPQDWQARFEPRWEPRLRRGATAALAAPGRCTVVGAGIAGASVAASLARRGWRVEVLDAGSAPAQGASGLPVGLFAPQLSADDNLVSRLSRTGVRAMLAQSAALLRAGEDWSPCGVLERRLAGAPGASFDPQDAGLDDWGGPAGADPLRSAGLDGAAPAWWHARAGWVRPARLVARLLAQPGIAFHPHRRVAALARVEHGGATVWRALDGAGALLAEADLLVVAAGPASNALLGTAGVRALPLGSLRGQLSWGGHAPGAALPPFPVNGHGALIAQVPCGEGLAWHAGSTFEPQAAGGATPGAVGAAELQAAHATNFEHLGALLPAAAQQLAPAFARAAACTDPHGLSGAQTATVHAWRGERCAAPDRLPLVGPVAPDALAGLWVCTAMGSRGLTRAVLCGELLAARLHGEPLPVDARTAQALAAERYTTG